MCMCGYSSMGEMDVEIKNEMRLSPGGFAERVMNAAFATFEGQKGAEGAILVEFEPKSDLMVEWLDASTVDAVGYSRAIIPWTDTYFRDKEGKIIEDATMGARKMLAAAKIGFDRVQECATSKMDYASENAPEDLGGEDVWRRMGAVAIPIGMRTPNPICPNRGELALQVNVSVYSNVSPEQDGKAVWAAVDEVKKIIAEQEGFVLQRCFYYD